MNANGARTLAYLRGETDLLQEREQFVLARKKSPNPALVFCLTEAQNRRVKRFWQVASLLHENSRMSLVEMSRKLKIPVSTLFETSKEVEKMFRFTIVLKDNVQNVFLGDTVPVELPQGLRDGGEKNEYMSEPSQARK